MHCRVYHSTMHHTLIKKLHISSSAVLFHTTMQHTSKSKHAHSKKKKKKMHMHYYKHELLEINVHMHYTTQANKHATYACNHPYYFLIISHALSHPCNHPYYFLIISHAHSLSKLSTFPPLLYLHIKNMQTPTFHAAFPCIHQTSNPVDPALFQTTLETSVMSFI